MYPENTLQYVCFSGLWKKKERFQYSLSAWVTIAELIKAMNKKGKVPVCYTARYTLFDFWMDIQFLFVLGTYEHHPAPDQRPCAGSGGQNCDPFLILFIFMPPALDHPLIIPPICR